MSRVRYTAQAKAEPSPQPAWDAERVRALRQHLGMTQQEMAQELGIRQQTVSEWERGVYRPRGGSSRLLSWVAERADFPYQPTGARDRQGKQATRS